MISGTALNLIVMQRLISIITLCPELHTVYGAYPFTFFEFHRTLDPTGTNRITSSVCVSHSRWALLAQWM
jgi:hypothetical protein